MSKNNLPPGLVDTVAQLRAKAQGLAEDLLSLEELLHGASVLLQDEAHSRRMDGQIKKLGRLTVDKGGKRALVDGVALRLTKQQFATLALLADNEGIVISNSVFEERVLGDDWLGLDSRSRFYYVICKLNQTLESFGLREYIETCRGYGYRLKSS